MSTTIIGLKLEDRIECSVEFQKIITEFGCEIRTRLGLHPVSSDACCNYGIVLLEVRGNTELLIQALANHWDVQVMKFD